MVSHVVNHVVGHIFKIAGIKASVGFVVGLVSAK